MASISGNASIFLDLSISGGNRMHLLRSFWQFIQNQVLGMKWLNEVIGNGLTALGLDITTRLGGSLQFFLYD